MFGCKYRSQKGDELLVRDVWQWMVVDHRWAIRPALGGNVDMSLPSTKDVNTVREN